jgi:CheY-like chemotaxis protein
MTDQSQNRRSGEDRRSSPRGGRRPGDPGGYSPLILVADDDASNGARCVAILSKLRFAVAPAHSIEEALKVLRSLHPNLIVARLSDEPELRKQMTEDREIDDVLIEEIRAALRHK